MKKLIMLAMVLGLLVSGCAMKSHCFIEPKLNEERSATTGSPIVQKTVCRGMITVNHCGTTFELTYLGKSGNQFRIFDKIDVGEILYPDNSRLIKFKDVEIEVIGATDNQITFKLKNISITGCTKVNGSVIK